MSYDIQTEARCDHRVHREIYLLDPFTDRDLRQLRIPFPLSNPTLRVWLNETEVLATDRRYGWSVQPNELSVPPYQLSKLVFRRPMESYSTYIEISYTSPPDFCRKCFGLGVLYDHYIDRKGLVKVSRYEQKLIQHIIKHIITKAGSNPFHTYLGTRISLNIYKALRDPSLFESQVLSDIEKLFSIYKINQYKQTSVQRVDLRELLADLTGLELIPNEDDPREYELVLTATTQAGAEIQVERELIAGDTFLSTPIREAGI